PSCPTTTRCGSCAWPCPSTSALCWPAADPTSACGSRPVGTRHGDEGTYGGNCLYDEQPVSDTLHTYQGGSRMSTEQHKAIVRRFFEDYSHATVDELVVPDYIHHDPSLPPELQRGREAYKQVVGMFLTAFPDLK